MNTSEQYAKVFNYDLFGGDFYNGSSLYMHLYGKLPSQYIIRNLDYPQALKIIAESFGDRLVQELHQTAVSCYDKKEEREDSYLIMKGEVLLALSFNYCVIYYVNASDHALISDIKSKLVGIKKKARRQPFEINIITQSPHGLRFTEMEIKRTKLDIGLYYEDDFKAVDEVIRKRLNQKRDKGIVLLHGLPGTGKTTYLRYLVGRIKKRVMFVPPDIAGRMSNPDLVKLLVDNPDTVLVVEDAESIIMQRRLGGDSAVSSLLNISDGLMSDFLNVQIICTFNSGLDQIDSALMRKGRLIARYEFGKLSVEKSANLSRHLGFTNTITEPMTVAEITNQQDMSFEQPGRTMIGFRSGAAVGF